MPDAKDARANSAMTDSATRAVQGLDRILKALAIDPERALEELNSDWTASQELADVLMRKYKLPFRAGHHFASEVVDYAKLHNIKPTEFPYAQAQAIYRKAAPEMGLAAADLPMSEAEFRATLDPVAIIRNRATSGGPQPAEMDRMLAEARQRLDRQDAWIRIAAPRLRRAWRSSMPISPRWRKAPTEPHGSRAHHSVASGCPERISASRRRVACVVASGRRSSGKNPASAISRSGCLICSMRNRRST